MKGSKFPYAAFFILMVLFNGIILITPYLASQGSSLASGLYEAFSFTCHQMINRSLCLFVPPSDGSFSIGDCTPQIGVYDPSKDTVAQYSGETGYKFPVCSRCMAIYLAMLLGLIILPFLTSIESEDWPNKWILVAACVPIGIDGFTQLFGLRESTNFLRIVTGVIIGVVLPFYILPILNTLYSVAIEHFGKKRKG